jgi:aminoglycoside phosphotransferase (APT) family kinase protein
VTGVPTPPTTAGLLPLDRLARWLAGQGLHLVSPLRAELTPAGRSNPTYIVTDAAGRRIVVRRPPFGGVLATAHDMSREWRFICALHNPAAQPRVPVPVPLAVCASDEVIGAPFFVMSYVEGIVAETMAALPAAAADEAARQLGDVLARLHQVDVTAAGLGSLARPESYLRRQLRRWKGAFDQSACRDVTDVDVGDQRLAAAPPPQARTTIVHGDYRIGNVICGPGGVIAAVLDWELATIGDPLADLGWLVADWADGQPDARGAAVALVTSDYARATGCDVSALPYYVAFAHWRGACILAGVTTRYEAGVMGDDGFAPVRAREQIGAKAAAALAILDVLPSPDDVKGRL